MNMWSNSAGATPHSRRRFASEHFDCFELRVRGAWYVLQSYSAGGEERPEALAAGGGE